MRITIVNLYTKQIINKLLIYKTTIPISRKLLHCINILYSFTRSIIMQRYLYKYVLTMVKNIRFVNNFFIMSNHWIQNQI